jgi:adenylate cyclase
MIRFLDFVIDDARGCLCTSGQREVPLRPKSFEVLSYLAGTGGRLVSKDEILKAVWPRVVVGDESLTQCVSEVRQAIGDARQEVIRTVPRRGYRFIAPVSWAEVPQPGSRPAHERRPVIAVLPFANRGGESTQDYLSDGVTEDITIELARFPELMVIASSSCFRYKGASVDVRQVGRELGAQYVLQGSLRREGERLRLAAQLAQTDTGGTVWAERYERRVQDLFLLQDELAHTVASILPVQIRSAEGRGVLLRPPATWNGYDLYLRAAEAFRERARCATAVVEAQAFAERSLASDPLFARAYALLSKAVWWQYAEPINDAYLQPRTLDRSLELARTAVQLDVGLPEAHAQLGWMLVFALQHEAGLAEFAHAFALNRNFIDNRHALALTYDGRAAQALAALQATLAIDPLQPLDSFGFIGHAHFMLGQYDEAVRFLSAYSSRAPAVRILPLWLAAAHAQAGNLASARREAAVVLRMEPRFDLTAWKATAVYRRAIDAERLFDGLRRAGLPEAAAAKEGVPEGKTLSGSPPDPRGAAPIRRSAP